MWNKPKPKAPKGIDAIVASMAQLRADGIPQDHSHNEEVFQTIIERVKEKESHRKKDIRIFRVAWVSAAFVSFLFIFLFLIAPLLQRSESTDQLTKGPGAKPLEVSITAVAVDPTRPDGAPRRISSGAHVSSRELISFQIMLPIEGYVRLYRMDKSATIELVYPEQVSLETPGALFPMGQYVLANKQGVVYFGVNDSELEQKWIIVVLDKPSLMEPRGSLGLSDFKTIADNASAMGTFILNVEK